MAGALENLQNALIRPSRGFVIPNPKANVPYSPEIQAASQLPVYFSADLVLEEVGLDRTRITDHPVELGASVTDHAFQLPAELSIKMVWSNSFFVGGKAVITSLLNGYSPQGGISLFGETTQRAINAYNVLLGYQTDRVPITIITGKRTYKNMLIEAISVVTDKHTENILFVSMHAKEVILVQTQAVTLASADVHSDPVSTGPMTPVGQQQLTELSNGIGQ